jgi:hypothetical protein
VGLGGSPPVRELSLLCQLIKREQSHWRRPYMTHKFGILYKKINYRLNRPKLEILQNKNIGIGKNFYFRASRYLNSAEIFQLPTSNTHITRLKNHFKEY